MTDLQRISRCRSLRKSSIGTCQLWNDWNDQSRRDQWKSGVLTTTSSDGSGGSDTSMGSPGGDSTVSQKNQRAY